ncbi:MAG: S8 family peptidase [Rubrivivax sp.]
MNASAPAPARREVLSAPPDRRPWPAIVQRRARPPLWLLAGALGLWVAAHATPALAAPAQPEEARIIVGFRADAAPQWRGPMSAPEAARLQWRADRLAQRAGRALQAGQGLGEGRQVLRAPGGDGLDSATLARRIAADPAVAWAVPDQRRRALFVPNDPLYPAAVRPNGPNAGQWTLRAPDATLRSAINAEAAWDRTLGSASVVIAVLDTGVRPEHPDLAGRLLPGIDTLADAFYANDGDGADADPTDPGDWVTATEVTDHADNCTAASGSSWHGTQVATLVGAGANDGIGMAGVAPGARILPVRVLGKCGGYDSEIIAGMRWAVGLQKVANVANAHPAQVLNLSLGGPGTCSAAYRDAIAQVVATGAVIVAAAGNTTGHAVSTPANCAGVIAVGGLRHAGTKVGFSDLGPEVALSAPAGNCVNIGSGEACLYPMIAGLNSGSTVPLAGGSAWSDGANISVGTSFSTPLVAGTAALVRSLRASLTPDEVRRVLMASARPFPQAGADPGGDPAAVPACRPADGSDQLQCYCPNDGSLCGAGMLDAAGAVAAAEGGFARIRVLTAVPTAGQPLRLDAGDSLAPMAHTIAGWSWSLVGGSGITNGFDSATDAVSAQLTPTAAGTLTVRLTLIDEQGGRVSVDRSVDVVAAATPPPPVGGSDPEGSVPEGVVAGAGGGGGGGAFGLGWSVGLAAAVAALHRRRGQLQGRKPAPNAGS